jgi:phage-related protein
MYFDGSDACWVPTIPYALDQQWRLRIAQFGDGYQQRILDGINALELSFNLSFDMRPHPIILDMDAYLSSMKGSAFPFFDPVSEKTFIVFCDKWTISWDMRRRSKTGDPIADPYDYYGTLTAEFVKANGVDLSPIT